jgi:hypothetical protein
LPIINSCKGLSFTYTITVKPKPATPLIRNNSPVCTGKDLNLTTTPVANATYSWTGPNGFGSILQNPTIANVTLAAEGKYSVIVTAHGCSSTAGTSIVVINATPSAPKVSNNGPVCEGATLQLTASNIAGANYNWNGPEGFTQQYKIPRYLVLCILIPENIMSQLSLQDALE